MYTVLPFEELTSTNAYAKQHAAVLEDKAVILARRQSAGRGRKGRAWASGVGGLFFSILLKPKKTEHTAALTLAMCLAICKTVGPLGLKPAIKWPNDVLVDGKKISGVLAEAVFDDGGVNVVLGCGVNTGQANIELGRPAASLKMLGADIENDIFLTRLLGNFFALYPGVIEHGFSTIKNEYLKYFNGAGVLTARGTLLLDGQELFTGD